MYEDPHSDIFLNSTFYLDVHIPNYVSVEYLILKHQGKVEELSSKTTQIVMMEKIQYYEKQMKLLGKKTKGVVEFAQKNRVKIISLKEFFGFFSLCGQCQLLQKNEMLVKEKEIKGIQLVLILENEKREILTKVFSTLTDVPKVDFSKGPGTCAIQSTHTLESKNETYFCECCKKKFGNYEKHCLTDEHLQFRNNEENYKEIDDIFTNIQKNNLSKELNIDPKQAELLFKEVIDVEKINFDIFEKRQKTAVQTIKIEYEQHTLKSEFTKIQQLFNELKYDLLNVMRQNYLKEHENFSEKDIYSISEDDLLKNFKKRSLKCYIKDQTMYKFINISNTIIQNNLDQNKEKLKEYYKDMRLSISLLSLYTIDEIYNFYFECEYPDEFKNKKRKNEDKESPNKTKKIEEHIPRDYPIISRKNRVRKSILHLPEDPQNEPKSESPISTGRQLTLHELKFFN